MSDRAFGGADTLATSYTLYHGLKKIETAKGKPFDLVLCGSESADGATAQVSSQLGEWLGYPHLWNVCSLSETGPGTFSIKTKLENGFMEWKATMPLVLAAARDLNKPRFTSMMGIMKAKNKPLTAWDRGNLPAADDDFLGLKGSPTQPGKIFTPDLKRAGEVLNGTPEEIAGRIVEILRAHGAALGA